MIRILSWLLVAAILHIVDVKLLHDKGKGVWFLLFVIAIIAIIFISENINQLIEDTFIIILGVSTVSLLAKRKMSADLF